MQKPDYLKTNIFLDSGNPEETKQIHSLLGFLDGQTTNPSLVAGNPHIQKLKENKELTEETIWVNYKEIVLDIHKIIPEGSISAEVYADKDTSVEEMLQKGRELATWFPGIYVKLPITKSGLEVAHIFAKEGININMTLCFLQEQAAAVHMATIGAKRGQVFISPFIGRLDDIGIEGLDIVKNISQMYKEWNSHVMVLGASIRNLDHLFGCMKLEADIITSPMNVLSMWAKEYGVEKDIANFVFQSSSKTPILYKNLEQKNWQEYNIQHDLTDKGLAKFSSDWKNLFS